MPKKLEQELMREAEKKGLTGARKDAYVYGTLRKQGWTPSGEGVPEKPSLTRRYNPNSRKVGAGDTKKK